MAQSQLKLGGIRELAVILSQTTAKIELHH